MPGMQEIRQTMQVHLRPLLYSRLPKLFMCPSTQQVGELSPSPWEGTRKLHGKWFGCRVPLQASEELDQWFLSSSGIRDIVLMFFLSASLVIPAKLLLWILLSPSIQHCRFPGLISLHSFLFACIPLFITLWVHGYKYRGHISISTSSEVQMHISFWMPYRHLKLSMYVPLLSLQPSLFQWLDNPSSNHPTQQPWIYHWVLPFSHNVIQCLGLSNWFYLRNRTRTLFLNHPLSILFVWASHFSRGPPR